MCRVEDLACSDESAPGAGASLLRQHAGDSFVVETKIDTAPGRRALNRRWRPEPHSPLPGCQSVPNPRKGHPMNTFSNSGAGTNPARGSHAVTGKQAHPGRVYDYLLGGKDNYAVDREAAEAMITQIPTAPMMAKANRAFLFRAVSHLVGDLGITELLDIGSGIPTMFNVHEVAQTIAPSARVVYVDKDPVVAAHSRALLASHPQGRTAFITADATEPAAILADPVLPATLDLSRPVALMLISVLMYFDDTTVTNILSTLVAALPAGSYLTISHPTADFDPTGVGEAVAGARRAGLTYIPRTRTQVDALFAGLDPCEPGVVPMLSWRPERQPPRLSARGQVTSIGPTHLDPRSVYYWVGMARVPPNTATH